MSDVVVYPREIPDHLEGNIFIITGTDSFIGKFVGNFLIKRGALVIKIVRSSRALQENEYQCDLSDPQQIFNFCEKFKTKYSKLNGIINLASGMYKTYEENDFGIEKTFATNVLAPYLLFKNLLPIIESTLGARVLNVINPLMLTVKMNPDDLNSKAIYYSRDRFLQCERYKVELWHHLAEEHPNIISYSVTPGFILTDGLEKKFPIFYSKYAYRTFTLRIFREVNLAGLYILWCLMCPTIGSIPNGALIFDKAVQKEYILKKHETLIEEHKVFISNFYKILESNVKEQLNICI